MFWLITTKNNFQLHTLILRTEVHIHVHSNFSIYEPAHFGTYPIWTVYNILYLSHLHSHPFIYMHTCMQLSKCADPESFVRRGPTLTFFCFCF